MPISGLMRGRVRESEIDLVVALRLSSCEILLKDYDKNGEVCYHHKKYGYNVLPGGHETPYQWYPVGSDWSDPKDFLEKYKAGFKTMYERMTGQIHGCPYDFPDT